MKLFNSEVCFGRVMQKLCASGQWQLIGHLPMTVIDCIITHTITCKDYTLLGCIITSHNEALVEYASIILGIIGASEHQELCWHNRYTFLIRWPEHCKLTISFDQVHCSFIPSNKFPARIFFRGLHTVSVMLECHHQERRES